MTLLQPVSSLHGRFDSHGFGVEPLHAAWTVPVEVVELQPDMMKCVTQTADRCDYLPDANKV